MIPQGRPAVGPTGGAGLAVRRGAAEVGFGAAEMDVGGVGGVDGVRGDAATVAGSGSPAAELVTGTGADTEASELMRVAAGWWCAVQPEIISAKPAARTTHRAPRSSFTGVVPRVEATSQRDAVAT